MKKFLALTVAALCCLAFAAPAFAEVKVEGMIQSDFYYFTQSKERVAGGVVDGQTTARDSWDTTRIAMPQPLNRLSVRYTGEDKVVNGYIQLRAGGIRALANDTVFANNGLGSESAFSWEYAWIDWHVNPSLYFRFGRQDQTFANAYAPAQGLGWNDGHIIGLGFGNISAQSRDAVRAFIRFTDNVRMEIEALDPNTRRFFTGGSENAGPAVAIPAQAGTGDAAGRALESNVIPRFDLSLPIKIANFTIEPGFTWHQTEYQQVAAGNDDSFTSWGATLGASAAFGPFSLSGEFTYGRNLGPNGNAGYWGAANGQPVVYVENVTGFSKVEDGKTIAYYIMAGFNFGPAAVQGIFGQNRGSNDGNPDVDRDAQEFKITQTMYGLNVPIFITKTFTITPSVWYYDFDGGAEVNARSATNDVDLGKEWTVGMTFQLVF